MKYSKEFKIDCVMKYKTGGYIEDPPGVNHRCFRNQVRRWVRVYDSLGEAGLEHGRPTLDLNQRLELIKRVESGESYQSVAFSAGIQDNQLSRWHRIYLEKGLDGLQSLKRGGKPMDKNKEGKSKSLKNMSNDEKLKYYEERNKYLEAENAYLKKLNALVQKRKVQERKKK